MKHFSHLIIGTGQATGTLLGKLIPKNETIGVIEADKVGGSCVNYGCTPTKTLVASAKAFYQAKRGDFFGFHSENLTLDYSKVRDRMDNIRNGSSNGLTSWMNNTQNVELIMGKARFTESKKIEVNGLIYTADNIYINVGTRPSAPPIPDLDTINWLDSARLLDLKNIPEHLIVIGGGYIGVEFAQVFRRFGSQVSIIQRNSQLMPREDQDVADTIKEFIESEGINVYCSANTINITQKPSHKEVNIEINGESKILSGDQVLVATGRTPNSDTLDLDNTGIKTNNRGFIEIDKYCETTVEGVFAVGDVNGHGGFTHTAVNDAEIVLDKLFGGDRTLYDRNMIYGLFTDPPLGRVGMTEKEAIKSGKTVLKAIKPMNKISRAKEMGETNGFVKILVDAETDLILGASILGVGGDEIINMFATIMHSKITYKEYRKIVLVHPTVSDLMPWTLDGLQGIK
ncbi:mercuric reductase [Aquimarina sp. I32.4]|uniref:mercuric reductase n=1 Tax=Aquimarina sp. I32.4 TaxID=2053903 RepID=UPI000CDE6212|nr:mercuric reductase [Aquimarina sp. I32.4]